eukprot:g1832.t1
MALRQLAPKLVNCNGAHFLDLFSLQRPVLTASHSLENLVHTSKVSFGTAAPGRPPIQSISSSERYRKGKAIEYKADSVGMIGDPYKGAARWITPLDLLYPTGWKYISSRVKNTTRNLYSLHLCRKHLNDFKFNNFKKEAFEIYKTTSEAFAAGNIDLLRKVFSYTMFEIMIMWIQMVTATLLAELKKEISVRKMGGWHRIHWSLSADHSKNKVKFLQARVLGIPNNKFTPAFVQCTLLFQNKQQFAAFDRRGKLKAGSKDDDIEVEDYWVFERLLNKESLNSKWRAAARLQITQS